jgi:anti-sigma factor RsiW
MNCEEAHEQIPDYLLGELDEFGKSRIEAHLKTCGECREEVAVWNRLAVLPDEQPSPALRARFEAMLAAYRAGLEQAQRRPFRISAWLETWWPHQPAWQAGIAMASLVVGLTAGLLLTGLGVRSQELAGLREEVRHTRQLVALSLLEQQSASERLRGVSWSERVGDPDREVLSALVETLKYDPSVDVRLAAVDAVRRFGRHALVRQGVLEALARQQSPLVQIALIDLVVEWRERRSIQVLRQLQADQSVNEAVRQRAAWGLQQLS